MANMNVKKRLEKIDKDLAVVLHHIQQYSGAKAPKDAPYSIDNLGTSVAQYGAAIAAEARKANGDKSADKLVGKVRDALGFTYR